MDEDSPLLTPEPEVRSTGGVIGDVGSIQGLGRDPCETQRRTPDKECLLTPEIERAASDATRGGINVKRKRPTGDTEPPCRQLIAGLRRCDSTSSTIGTPTASADKYKKIKKVGVGAYGSVFMAENTETKEIVAIKLTSRKEDVLYGGFPVSLLREIAILRTLKHDNVVQLHELAQTSTGDTLMVMEYCQSSLLELLNSRRHDLSFSEVKYVIRQVLDACRHMHEKGILHRDLATKNVLFNLSGEIKVCDFGISRFAFGRDEEFGFVSADNLENPNMIVSLPYRAVELLLGQADYGPALDIWAAGCILGEILLCQGGVRRTFFGGDPDSPNKTPQAIVEEVFSLCGRATEQTWTGLNKLPLLRQYCSTSAKIDRLPAHSGATNEERLFLRKFFATGVGKCAHSKYSLTEACFDLLGGVLTLNPSKRLTAEDALRHGFFAEKPLPEWHASHWATNTSDIARGDDMRRQERDAGDDARALLRKLSTSEDVCRGGDPSEAKSMRERAKEAMEKRAQEKKQEEERRLAQVVSAQRKGDTIDGEQLPVGWSKHWSSSKQIHYYHEKKSGKNQWFAPIIPKR